MQKTLIAQTSGSRLFPPARIVGFGVGGLLSSLAAYNWTITLQFALRQPLAILPDAEAWDAGLLGAALTALRLPGSFFAAFALAFSLLFTLSFLTCGWLILWHKRRDWFGLYLGLVFLIWADGAGGFYSTPEIEPGLAAIRSYLSWISWPGLFLLLYFFPTGHVVPRWARWFAMLLGGLIVYGLVVTAFRIEVLAFSIAFPFIILCLLVGGYAQQYRFRHAAPVERQQIKWVVLSQLIFVLFFITFSMLINLQHVDDPAASNPAAALLVSMILLGGLNVIFMGLPISITLAMFRFRLWDVDVVIRRTLQYSLLTGVLGLAYFGSIVVLQNTVGWLTGDEISPLVTVVSTLAIAALFNPLRIRTQHWIDQRFFRSKYNSERIIAGFAGTARDEVDMNKLTTELLGVVQDAMQPERANLWLRPDKKKRDWIND